MSGKKWVETSGGSKRLESYARSRHGGYLRGFPDNIREFANNVSQTPLAKIRNIINQ